MDIKTAESAPEQVDQVRPADRMAPAQAGRAKALADGTLKPGWNRRSRSKIRISKGGKVRATLPHINGNSTWSRRLKELLIEAVQDKGGPDCVASAELHIIRRACVLVVELERIEARFAAITGEAKLEDLHVYSLVATRMRSLLEAVGLQRRPRTVGPSLGDMMLPDLKSQREREQAPVDATDVVAVTPIKDEQP